VKLLLDTQVVLWWATDPGRVPAPVIDTLTSPTTELYFSAASSWEVQIKIGLGRLTLTEPWDAIVDREVTRNGVNLLPVTFPHTYRLGDLPPLHRDPFDRLLLAQSIAEGMRLVSGDAKLHEYPDAPIFWG
jgi:PIN domain nuclease of toxin-antitoxin system